MRLYPKRGTCNTKMSNNIDINLCKSAKACLPYSVLRERNDQCKDFKCGFTPDSNPKRGNQIGIYLCKLSKVKIIDISYLRPEYVLTNASILSLVFPLTATPKGVTKLTCIYVKGRSAYRTLGFQEYGLQAILGVPLPLTALPKRGKQN